MTECLVEFADGVIDVSEALEILESTPTNPDTDPAAKPLFCLTTGALDQFR
jgi:hypothetical protein